MICQSVKMKGMICQSIQMNERHDLPISKDERHELPVNTNEWKTWSANQHVLRKKGGRQHKSQWLCGWCCSWCWQWCWRVWWCTSTPWWPSTSSESSTSRRRMDKWTTSVTTWPRLVCVCVCVGGRGGRGMSRVTETVVVCEKECVWWRKRVSLWNYEEGVKEIMFVWEKVLESERESVRLCVWVCFGVCLFFFAYKIEMQIIFLLGENVCVWVSEWVNERERMHMRRRLGVEMFITLLARVC